MIQLVETLNTFAAAESHFAQRVRRLLRGRVGRMTLGLSIASVVALMIGGCLGLPTAAARAPREETDAKEIAMRTEQPPTGEAAKAKVKREGGKVWIAGMEELRWPQGQENSSLRSLAIALQTVGEDVSYERLMGVSGHAFRTQFHQTGFCGSSPHACCGFNTLKTALAALDYDLAPHSFMDPEHELDKDDPEDVRRTREAVTASIDRGWPVIFGSEEDGLVVGYQDGGETLLVRSYFDWTEPGFGPMKDWPWGFSVLTKKDEAPDRRECALNSLKLAVRLANVETVEVYASGFAAYDRWMAELLDEAKFEDANDDEKRVMIQMNAHIYNSLIDARTQAAGYLRSIGDEFTDEASEHLARAAGLYDDTVKLLDAGRENVPWPWQLEKLKDWTKKKRHAEAAALKEVLALERKAIAEIERALADL